MEKELFKKEIAENSIRWYDNKENAIIIKDNLEQIEQFKEHLKQSGVILFLVNNKNGLANSGKTNTYTKAEIEKYLKKLEIINYKFYYPLSNYEQANTIFSEDYLPEYNNSKLLNNVFYDENTVIKYNEIEAIKTVTKAGKFVDYTNSYIVEIGNRSPIKFVSYNNSRKPEYRLITKVYEDKVVKQAVNEKAEKHIEQIKSNNEALEQAGFNMLDKFEAGTINSKLVEGKTLYDEVLDKIFEQKVEEAYKLIGDWYKYIEEKSKTLSTTYIDLVLENTFYRDGDYLFFDQEWEMKDAPLEFILYRTINNLYTYNPEITSIIDKADFFEKFGLNEKQEQMQKYEQELQNKVVDLDLVKAYDEEYRAKYVNVVPFEFYIKENLIEKILKKLK